MTPVTAPAPAPASLGQYLRFLWRRKASIILAVAVAAGAAYVVDGRRDPIYESYTDLLFSAGSGNADARGVSVATEARVATSPAVLDAALDRLHAQAGGGTAALGGAVDARQAGDIAVLRISARHRSPTMAAEVADAVSDAYLEERTRRTQEQLAADSAEIAIRLAELGPEIDRLAGETADHEAAGRQQQAAVARQQMNVLAGEQSVQQGRLYQLRLAAATSDDDVSVLVPAAIPREPVSPRPLRSAAIGGLVGLLAGLGIAMAREHLGASVRRSGEVEAVLGLPVLGVVPRMRRRQLKRSPVAVLDTVHPDVAEPYRILRANLAAAGLGEDLRVLLVTSSVSAEGKSTTAANIAASFAEARVNTLLVDGDLRRPQIHRLFRRSNTTGLSSLLDGRLDAAAIGALMEEVRVAPHLSVLPAGPASERPGQTILSGQFAHIVAALRTKYVIVIDAPPVLPVADVGALTPDADAVLVVVRPDLVREPELVQLRKRLAQLNAPVLGAVVNAADRSSFDAGTSYGYYQGYGETPSRNGSAGAFARILRANR